MLLFAKSSCVVTAIYHICKMLKGIDGHMNFYLFSVVKNWDCSDFKLVSRSDPQAIYHFSRTDPFTHPDPRDNCFYIHGTHSQGCFWYIARFNSYTCPRAGKQTLRSGKWNTSDGFLMRQVKIAMRVNGKLPANKLYCIIAVDLSASQTWVELTYGDDWSWVCGWWIAQKPCMVSLSFCPEAARHFYD